LLTDSQFYDEDSKEPDTPISSQQFLNSIQNRAADLGRIIGVGYAEGFTTQRQLGRCSDFRFDIAQKSFESENKNSYICVRKWWL
jgi:hypothetical protein